MRLAADSAGIFQRRNSPGLWLDRGALLRGDMAAVLEFCNGASPRRRHVAERPLKPKSRCPARLTGPMPPAA